MGVGAALVDTNCGSWKDYSTYCLTQDSPHKAPLSMARSELLSDGSDISFNTTNHLASSAAGCVGSDTSRHTAAQSSNSWAGAMVGDSLDMGSSTVTDCMRGATLKGRSRWHSVQRAALAGSLDSVLVRLLLGISRGPSPNASHAGDTPRAFASDSRTSTPVCAPFSMLAMAVALRSSCRASATLVSPRSIRTEARRAPMPSVVAALPSVFCSPSPYPNQPAETPSARAKRARLPTVGIRALASTRCRSAPSLSGGDSVLRPKKIPSSERSEKKGARASVAADTLRVGTTAVSASRSGM